MATDPTKNYPLPKFHFEVDWGGTRIGFTEVSGLEAETEVIEYREGSNKLYHKNKQPGLTKYSNITLKRGTFKGDFEFFQWWQKTFFFQEVNAKYRRDISIKLLDEAHVPIITWSLANAWPCRVKWGNLNAMDNEVLMEELEITHEGLSIPEAP
jgi:phage tail-like protein